MSTLSHILGFPRMGVHRELKTAVESYWKNEMSHDQLIYVARQIKENNWKTQNDAGLHFVTVGDFCFYDHVLDHSVMFGVVPERFKTNGQPDLDTYFKMARGGQQVTACEMTKWFNTNYHYIVPELTSGQNFTLNAKCLLDTVEHAKACGYKNVKPVILGPVSFLWLSKTKSSQPFDKFDLLKNLLPVYNQLLQKLANEKIEWVQIDEPILVLDLPTDIKSHFSAVYGGQLTGQTNLKLLLSTYFGGLGDNLPLVNKMKIDGLHTDLCAPGADDLARIFSNLPKNAVLSLGVINGRNIWKADLHKELEILKQAHQKLGAEKVWVSSSCSLLHSPVDLDAEKSMDAEIKSWLAFAKQKVAEVALLTKALNEGEKLVADELEKNRQSISTRNQSTRIHDPKVKDRIKTLPVDYGKRAHPYAIRAEKQRELLKLPLLPTTTIGSFPQTKEIRSIRHDFKAKKIDEPAYVKKIREQIASVVAKEETLGLDVLVHGEAERNDMVEYFGELLNGYTFSGNGWVQSYGSRCVKPPIIFGDVSRPVPMTIEWIKYAQSLTKCPMKGMLTGPVTMLSWSFVRDDQPTSVTSLQIALALRDEIIDLEKNGINVIQLDEPAFREALPLRKKDWKAYLEWSVHSFRVATSGVQDHTQIHTHMCYSEFNDIIDSIAALDADVITIENSRSDMELLKAFENFSYPNEIGPGVYDIHSPRVPSVEEIVSQLETGLKYLPVERLWVNPDCGLKTRNWPETDQALINMVQAAKMLRQKYKKK